MKRWKAHYQDERHDLDIDIINTEDDYRKNPLSFQIGEFRFCGTSLGDFELENPQLYEKAREEFHILKWDHYSDKNIYYYALQRYYLETDIPIAILKKQDNRLIEGFVHISFAYKEHDLNQAGGAPCSSDNKKHYPDDAVVSDFSLLVENKRYRADEKKLYAQTLSLYFEPVLKQFCERLQAQYRLQCCFTYQYSDYSPYGNDDYGLMLCYKAHKAEYLKVNNKQDYFSYLEGLPYEGRQETYLCGAYEPRIHCGGYRGRVPV